MVFKGSYKQALKWCKENKVRVDLYEGVKGGHRLQVLVKKECKMHGKKVYPGMRTIRINRPPKLKLKLERVTVEVVEMERVA